MNTSHHFKTIKLERTMCFGSCPVYKVSIHSSGRVTYTGIDWVNEIGRRIWYIDDRTIEKLNNAIVKCDYFNIQQNESGLWCTDMAYCITRIELSDGNNRIIEHYLQEDDDWPLSLLKFERQVEKLIGVDKYVGKEKMM